MDNKEATSLLKKNPIFEESRESSKIATVISELKKLRDKNKASSNSLIVKSANSFFFISIDNNKLRSLGIGRNGKGCDNQPVDFHAGDCRDPHKKTWNAVLCNKWRVTIFHILI